MRAGLRLAPDWVRAGGNCASRVSRGCPVGSRPRQGQIWGRGGRGIRQTRVQSPGFPSLHRVAVGECLGSSELR